jgi:hypothetical protein
MTDQDSASQTPVAKTGDHVALWAQLVGRFVLAFGEIEWGVCQALVRVPERNQFPAMKRCEFKVRATAAIKHTNDRVQDDAVRRALVRAINEGIKLADSRNLIAHNPAQIAIYTDGDEEDPVFRMEIISMLDETKFVTQPQLQALAEKAESVAAEMVNALRRVYAAINPLSPADFNESA